MAKLNGETLWLRLAEVTTSVLVHDCSKIVRVTVPAFLSGTAVGPAPGAAAAPGPGPFGHFAAKCAARSVVIQFSHVCSVSWHSQACVVCW